MRYRICKSFEIETGHMLSKHPGRCRFPHGHSRRIDVVLSSDTLDKNDIVCDFKAVNLALADFLDRLDHALAVNSDDPALEQLRGIDDRIITFDHTDPTTEVLAKYIFDHLVSEFAQTATYRDEERHEFHLRPDVIVERVRVTETPTSWAEYGG